MRSGGALRLKPDKEAYNTPVWVYIHSGPSEKASETLEKAIQSFPDELGFYHLFVRDLIGRNERDKARHFLQQGLERYPQDEELQMLWDFIKE